MNSGKALNGNQNTDTNNGTTSFLLDRWTPQEKDTEHPPSGVLGLDTCLQWIGINELGTLCCNHCLEHKQLMELLKPPTATSLTTLQTNWEGFASVVCSTHH